MLLELEVSHMMEKHLLCLLVTWPKLNGVYLGASAKPGTAADTLPQTVPGGSSTPPKGQFDFFLF